MKVKDIFKNAKVILALEANSKEELLRKLVDNLPIEKENREFVFSTLLKRESFGSTGIGEGIAIPHTRTLILKELVIIVARLKKPVNFDAIDKKPVKIVFFIVAPPNDNKNRYLITLGKIAELARDLTKNKRIFEITDEGEFIRELEKILEKKK